MRQAAAHVAVVTLQWQGMGDRLAADDAHGAVGGADGGVVGEKLGRGHRGHVAPLVPLPRGLQQHQTRRLQFHVQFADLTLNAGKRRDGLAEGGRHTLQGEADGGIARRQCHAEVGRGRQQGEPGRRPVAL